MMSLRFAFLAAILTATVQLTGCATSATPQAMTIKGGQVAPAPASLKGQVSVGEITGGKETNPMWTSQVDNAGFKKALEDSMAVAGYSAAQSKDAKYSVTAKMVSLDQPFMGLTFDVKSKVDYTVTGQGVTKSIPISATGTATTSDAFAGVERLRIANERSILENIKAFLAELAKQF